MKEVILTQNDFREYIPNDVMYRCGHISWAIYKLASEMKLHTWSTGDAYLGSLRDALSRTVKELIPDGAPITRSNVALVCAALKKRLLK